MLWVVSVDILEHFLFLNILAMYALNYIPHSIAPKILANQQWIGAELSCYLFIKQKLIHACFSFHGYRSASYKSGAWNCRPHQWSFWNADNCSNPSPGMCLFAFLWTSLDVRLLITWNSAFWKIILSASSSSLYFNYTVWAFSQGCLVSLTWYDFWVFKTHGHTLSLLLKY